MKAQTKDCRLWACSSVVFCLFMLLFSVTDAPAITPDIYERDNSPASATATLVFAGYAKAQRHNFHKADDKDWVQFCAIPGIPYEIEGKNVGTRSDLGLELYDTDGKTLIMSEYWPDGSNEVHLSWKCEKGGMYYVRALPNDPSVFGKGTQYDLALYIPAMPQGFGNLTGFILDASTQKPIRNLKISTSGKAYTWYNKKKGDYVVSDTVGSYRITLTAEGYKSFSSQINILDFKTIRKDFSLEPLSLRDLSAETFQEAVKP